MTTTPADLFAQALTFDHDGDVSAVDVPLARQAVDLHLSMGGDLRELLEPYQWNYYPQYVLSLVFDDDDLDRECRLLACWCARSVLHRALPADLSNLETAISVAERFAHGNATTQELKAGRRAAELVAETARAEAGLETEAYAAAAAAYSAVAATGTTAAVCAAGVTARYSEQQKHLIAVVCEALQ